MKIKKRVNPERRDRVSGVHFRNCILVVGFLIGFLNGYAQDVDRAFLPGERITYGAYYNWHFIWVNAGEVIFSTDSIQKSTYPLWNLKAVGKTYKAYDLLYTVRDTFESYLNYQQYAPISFRRVMNHGSKFSGHQYQFDQANETIYSYIKRDDEPKAFSDTLALNSGTFDILSSAYYFRSYQFSEMNTGEQVKFRVIIDNKQEELFFRYLGKEVVKTRKGEKFQCYKVSLMLLDGDFFPKGEHMKVWFTADQNKIPVMVETKISVGSVKAILTGYEHLKYPLTSRIN